MALLIPGLQLLRGGAVGAGDGGERVAADDGVGRARLRRSEDDGGSARHRPIGEGAGEPLAGTDADGPGDSVGAGDEQAARATSTARTSGHAGRRDASA